MKKMTIGSTGEQMTHYLDFSSQVLWNRWLRGTLYVLGLGFLFVGISIVSDIFMQSIEMITSKKRVVKYYDAEAQVSCRGYFSFGRAGGGYFSFGRAGRGYFSFGRAGRGYFSFGRAGRGYFSFGRAGRGYFFFGHASRSHIASVHKV